jgi:hypothetical protein
MGQAGWLCWLWLAVADWLSGWQDLGRAASTPDPIRWHFVYERLTQRVKDPIQHVYHSHVFSALAIYAKAL